MPLNDKQKAVLTRYKSYIQKGDYEGFFNNINSGDRVTFAEFLYIDAGIDFLRKMKNIPSQLFYGSVRLQGITIPSNIVNIESYAFYGCTQLTDVTIDSGVQIIGAYSFGECYKLNNISLNDGLKRIEKQAFIHDKALNKIIIPESCYDLGSAIFEGCADNLIIVTEYRPEGAINRIRVKQSDIPFYRQHLKFTHMKSKKAENEE